GIQSFTRLASASAIVSMPRFWRMYFPLWLIRRWRLPAAPAFTLPEAVSLKRFLTPLLVFSFGISSSLDQGAGPKPHAKRVATACRTGRATQEGGADSIGVPARQWAGRGKFAGIPPIYRGP